MNTLAYFLSVLDTIKMYHWMTQSHPRHVASDQLHDRLTANVDRFMEVMIGKYGRPSFGGQAETKLPMKHCTDATIITFLDSVIKYLVKELPKSLSKEDVDLFTIRDEMVADINQAKYLFTLH